MRGAPGQPVGLRVAGLSVINLGQVPSSGATTFDATSIVQGLLGPVAPLCSLTAEALPLPDVLAPVQQAVQPVLGAVQGIVPAAQQPAPGAPATPPPATVGAPQAAAAPLAPAAAPMFGPMLPDFTPFSLGRFHSSLPLYNYAELLVGRPGTIGRLQAGMLNTNLFDTATSGVGGLGAVKQQDPAAQDVAAAGQASALPASSTDRIALPALVAVLMLAAVSAALIRSWVVVTRR
ncbi:MAG: hypothetical protein ACRDSP_08065 [Pseudonocardiaceae bacterium]